MIKKIFKYLSLALVFLLVAGFFLVQGGGTSNQQLKNVATPATINDVVDLSSSNLTVSAQGLSTSVNLNENQLATFVKLVLGDNLGQAGDMAIGLDKDQIRMEMPVKFSVVNSKAILYGKPKLENESLVIDVTQTKLGNLPLPRGLFLDQLKKQLGTDSAITVEGNTIRMPLQFPLGQVADLVVKDNKVQLSLTIGQ